MRIKEIIDNKFEKLSITILDSINILNPDLTILLGELFNCYDDSVGLINKKIKKNIRILVMLKII